MDNPTFIYHRMRNLPAGVGLIVKRKSCRSGNKKSDRMEKNRWKGIIFPSRMRMPDLHYVLESQAVFLRKLCAAGTTKVRFSGIGRAALNAKSLGGCWRTCSSDSRWKSLASRRRRSRDRSAFCRFFSKSFGGFFCALLELADCFSQTTAHLG